MFNLRPFSNYFFELETDPVLIKEIASSLLVSLWCFCYLGQADHPDHVMTVDKISVLPFEVVTIAYHESQEKILTIELLVQNAFYFIKGTNEWNQAQILVLTYLSQMDIKSVFSFWSSSIISAVLMLGRYCQLLMWLRKDTVSVIMCAHSSWTHLDSFVKSGMYSSTGPLEF